MMLLSNNIIKKEDIGNQQEKFKIPVKVFAEYNMGIKNESLESAEINIQEKMNLEKQKIEIQKKLLEAKKESEYIISSAKEEAEELLTQTAKKGYDEGFSLGLKQGYKDGYEEGKKESVILTEKAKYLMKSAHENAMNYIANTEKEIVELAISIAKRVIGQVIEKDENSIIEIVKNACFEARNKKQIIIYINPLDKDIFRRNLEGIKEVCPSASVSILEDLNIEKNGCVIESESQIIDAQITTQMNKIKESLVAIENDGVKELCAV